MITFVETVMVLASIGIVAWPLLKGNGKKLALAEDSQISEMLAQKDATLFAISELEADYNMGNLSQGDYQELRQKYEQKAVALIKTMDGLRTERGLDVGSSIEDEIESRVSQLRASRSASPDIEAEVSKPRSTGRQGKTGKSCPCCGTRVEGGDLFCSQCGATLSLKCPGCSAPVEAKDKFCSHCGTALNNNKKGRQAA